MSLFGLNGQVLVKLEDDWVQISAESALEGKKVVAFYFSAHWCPPCRAFTPILKDVYDAYAKEFGDLEIYFNIVPLETTCSSWSTPSPKHHCTPGEKHLTLNASMKLSDTESCGSSCKAQNKEGCCYLDNIHGCFWYEGSNATTVESAPTMVTATLCSAIGRRNNCINSVYVSHHYIISYKTHRFFSLSLF